jgi:hypothetical protein
VCLDVEAPETIKNRITETIVGSLCQGDEVKISDDQASAFVVFKVEVIENASSRFAASIVASSHGPIDTLLNNITDADSEKVLRKDYKDVAALEWNSIHVARTVEDLCEHLLSDIEENGLDEIRADNARYEQNVFVRGIIEDQVFEKVA